MAAVTRSRIASLTPYASRITFDTAARDTPAVRATSSMVARVGVLSPVRETSCGEGGVSGVVKRSPSSMTG